MLAKAISRGKLACPLPVPMSYASLIVALADQPTTRNLDGRELIHATAAIQGSQPVDIALQAIPGTASGDALLTKQQGALLIASGEVCLIDDGNTPLITAGVICDAHPDQYLNEVVVVGHVGGEARMASSGKSASRSVATNRYRRRAGGVDPIEETDWYRIRGFGFNLEKLERINTGALVQVTGSFSQMTSAKGDPYCEIRARAIRVHRNKGGGSNPAAGTTAAGYDQESYMGSADDIGTTTDWN
jgi:single-stranded DNA-binding protein